MVRLDGDFFSRLLGSIQAITNWGETSQNINTMFANDAMGRESLYSYDAWGQRRDTKDWSGFPWTQSSTSPVTTWAWDNPATTGTAYDEDDLIPRGFTGHEMMDPLGLINMNGRIYDPRLGRFLCADLYVQYYSNSQSYNRYSYVMNNPLRYTDTSGFDIDPEAKAVAMYRILSNAANNGGNNSAIVLSELRTGRLTVVIFDGKPEIQRVAPDGSIVSSTAGGYADARNISDGHSGTIGLDGNLDDAQITTTLVEEVRETMSDNRNLGSREARENDSMTFSELFTEEALLPAYLEEVGRPKVKNDTDWSALKFPTEDNVLSTRNLLGQPNATLIAIMARHMYGNSAPADAGASGTGIPSSSTASNRDTVAIVGPNGESGTDVTRFFRDDYTKEYKKHNRL